MHRVGYLFEKIVSMENLKNAVLHATKGKKKRKNVQRFLENEDQKLLQLQKHLLDGSYKCMPYTIKTITDRGSGKVREIAVPKFYPDQIVQWAVMLQVERVLKKGMYEYSCASIRGKGLMYGFRKVKRVINEDKKNTKYCLSMDVRKFYPSINQDILMQKLRRKIKDEKTLNLLEKIVRSVPSGVPIGNYTSQWFANFYLTDLDHFIKEKLHVKYYVRYMDDLLCMGSNKRKLHQVRKAIDAFLAGEKLCVKPNWQVYKLAGSKTSGRAIDFLGYQFFEGFIRLRGRTFLRATRRINRISHKKQLTSKDSSACISYVAKLERCSGNAWYAKYFDEKFCIKSCKRAISKKAKIENLSMAVLC